MWRMYVSDGRDQKQPSYCFEVMRVMQNKDPGSKRAWVWKEHVQNEQWSNCPQCKGETETLLILLLIFLYSRALPGVDHRSSRRSFQVLLVALWAYLRLTDLQNGSPTSVHYIWPLLCPWKDHRDGKLPLLVTGESWVIFFLLKCIPVPWGECISFSTLEPHNSTCILELLIVVQELLKKIILSHYLHSFSGISSA